MFNIERRPYTETPSERDRILTARDFPEVTLSGKAVQLLEDTHHVHIILDHNKPELAEVQAELAAEWTSTDRLIYATNGPGRINPVNETEIIKRPALPNHLGVPDLVATATQDVLTNNNFNSANTWISFASADVWMFNPTKLMHYLAQAIGNSQLVVTSYCGGLGLPATLKFPQYYFKSVATAVPTFRGTGLMTEFFAIRADLAAQTIASWNDPEAGYLCYENLHSDPQMKPYLNNGQGVVEAHFRYLIAQELGLSFNDSVYLMHPGLGLFDKPARVYPEGTGYTSTHRDFVRFANTQIATENGFDPSISPSLQAWMRSRRFPNVHQWH
jgi:hypothetical protein